MIYLYSRWVERKMRRNTGEFVSTTTVGMPCGCKNRGEVFSLASPAHWPCILPVVSECSFDSLSLQECLEEFLIGLFRLPAQLLFSLPPQNLPKAMLNNRIGGNQTNTDDYVVIQEALAIPESVSSAVVLPHQTQTLAWCGRREAYRCGGKEWGGGRSGHCSLHGP